MELVLAVAVPCTVLWLFAVWRYDRGSADRRAAAIYLGLTALWLAPCWLTESTPVSLDFLTQIAPWSHLRPPGYLDKNFLLNDIPLQMLPWHEAARRLVIAGELPFIGRYAGAGTALWTNLQLAMLFPTTLLGFFFSTFGWAIFAAASKLLVALWGMDRFLRATGLGARAAIFGAVAYGLGAFTITYMMFPHTNVTTLLPLLLLAIHSIGERVGGNERVPWRSAALFASTLFLMIAGGHPESVLHCSFVAIPFALRIAFSKKGGSRGRFLLAAGVAGVVALLASAVLLVPFASYLPDSQRVDDIRTQPGFLSTAPLEWKTLIPFVLPNYFGNPRVHNYRETYSYNEIASQYVGLVPLVLACVVMVTDWKRHRFWLTLLIVTIFLAIEPLWLSRLITQVPLIGLAAHSRLRFVMAFILALLGAEGFQRVEERRELRPVIRAAATTLIAVPLFCIASYPLFAQYGIRRLIFFTSLSGLLGTAALLLGCRAWNPALFRVVIPLLVLDLFGMTGLYNPANHRDLAYPPSPAIAALQQRSPGGRVVGIGRALMPNTSAFYDLEDVRVHDPLSFRPYVAFLDAAGFDRSGYFGQFHTVPPRAFLDYLGVRSVILPPQAAGWSYWDVSYGEVAPSPAIRAALGKRPDLGDLHLVADGADAEVFDNPTTLPRFFIPNQVSASRNTAGDFFQARDPRHVWSAEASEAGPAMVTSRSEGAARMRIAVDASAPTFVASSEVALPGWELLRNGSPWPLQRINGAFLGWHAPAGRGEFVLRYRPPHFIASALATTLGLLLILVMAAAGDRRMIGVTIE